MNKRLIVLLLFMVFTQSSNAQNVTFWELGGAEKWWVITHPFSVKEAENVSHRAIRLADSLSKSYEFPVLKSGGEKDALRHSIWMALLSKQIGVKKALKLGTAHEKKNIKDFKLGRKEEGYLPDQSSVKMDLFNNKMGAEIFKNCSKNCSDSVLVNRVLQRLLKGDLRKIKMDTSGNSLDKNDAVIPLKEWEGRWENKRILVPSNFGINQNE